MSPKTEYLVELIFKKLKNYKAKKIFLEKKFLNRVSFVAVFTFLNGILFTDFSTELLDSEISQRIISSLLAGFLGLSLNELLSIFNNASEIIPT